jgi:hypothetical protein
VVFYLQKVPVSKGCILFDRESFWLISSEMGRVEKVEKSMWVNNGSKSMLQAFLTVSKSPSISKQIEVCNLSNVQVVEGEAFLGHGASGRVFKVTKDTESLALKIVLEESTNSLHAEYIALENAEHTGLAIRPIGKVMDTSDESSALLLGNLCLDQRQKVKLRNSLSSYRSCTKIR